MSRWDCLDLFALNVSTDFISETTFLSKILRTLLTSRSNHYQAPLDWVLKLHIYTNKKDFDKSQSLFYGADSGSLLELFNEKFLPIVTAPVFLPLDNDIENYFKTQGIM